FHHFRIQASSEAYDPLRSPRECEVELAFPDRAPPKRERGARQRSRFPAGTLDHRYQGDPHPSLPVRMTPYLSGTLASAKRAAGSVASFHEIAVEPLEAAQDDRISGSTIKRIVGE